MHSRKTLLFNNGEPWIKKGDEENFEKSVSCLDGAEVFELTGTYLLHQLIDIIPKEDLGLYRDDGLGTVNNLSGPEKERIKKQIVRIFKINGLNITIKTNLKTADFLDVHFDLIQDIYKPYKKPNDDPLYINKNSNHPPTIIKQIPKAIAKRISDISSNKEIYDQNINYYKEALERSGYNNITLPYNPSQQQRQDDVEQREQRKRKIIWFNPPFSLNVKTSVGKKFLKLLTRHFPKSNPLHKLFNRNTVKISYCCMKNMGSIISSHNKQILQPSQEKFGCNCRNKTDCPLDNKCLTPNIVYEAQITNNTNHNQKRYLGASETPFKERFSNHKRDFKHKKYEKCTELSKYIWSLKSQGIIPKIKWRIVKKVNSVVSSNYCKLCLTEKFYIIESLDDKNLLNKKSELVSKCRHQNKLLLCNVKRNYSMD